MVVELGLFVAGGKLFASAWKSLRHGPLVEQAYQQACAETVEWAEGHGMPARSESWRLLVQLLNSQQFVTVWGPDASPPNEAANRLSIVWDFEDPSLTDITAQFVEVLDRRLTELLPRDDRLQTNVILRQLALSFELFKQWFVRQGSSSDIREPASWIGRPGTHIESFFGRETELQKLDALLSKPGSRALISGVPGMGKSRLAAEWSARSGVTGFWTSARATVDLTLAALGIAAGLTRGGESDQDLAAGARLLLARTPDEAVWVVDNIVDFAQVPQILEASGGVRVLITTRNATRSDLPPGIGFVPLRVLDEQAAIDLLRSRGGDGEERTLRAIATAVGRLPLAVEVLSVRLSRPLESSSTILSDLSEALTEVELEDFKQNADMITVARVDGVYRAMRAAIESLGAETRSLLAPFGYLADAPVPRELAMALVEGDESDLRDLLRDCAQESVLTWSGQTAVIHPLMAAAIRSFDRGVMLNIAVHAVRTRLVAISNDDPEALRSEISHFEVLLARSRTMTDGPPAELVLRFASDVVAGYTSLGRARDAVVLGEETLERSELALGPEHPDTLAIRNNLAGGYLALGRKEQSVALSEETLRIGERVLGPDHPDTLTSRSNLARGYLSLDRTAEAVEMDEGTRRVRDRVLGPEHRDTLASCNNLANGYMILGRREEAVAVYKDALQIGERVLGPVHPVTLMISGNLITPFDWITSEDDAYVFLVLSGKRNFISLKRTRERVEFNQDSLETMERVLGPEHQSTLACRKDLALGYLLLGRRKEARALLENTLETMERVLGPEHPSTIECRYHLSDIFWVGWYFTIYNKLLGWTAWVGF